MGNYLKKIKGLFQTASDTLTCYLRGDLPEAESTALKTKKIALEADNIQRKIWDMLYKGVYLPKIREDICTILKNIDKTANAAQECCELFLSQQPNIPERFKRHYAQMVERSFQVVYPLSESILSYLKSDNIIHEIREKAMHFRNTKNELHQEARELKRQIFSCNLEPWEKIQLNACMEGIIGVSDQAGDAADDMQRIAVKLVV